MAEEKARQDLLRSWKEIALYLKVHEKTARRWERERGLPVKRLSGGQRAAVFAYRQEIDDWLRQNQGAEFLDSRETVAGKFFPARGLAEEANSSSLQSSTDVGSQAVPAGVGRLGYWLDLALSVLVAVATALSAGRSGKSVATVRLGQFQVQALDAAGDVLWRYELPRPAKLSNAVADQLGRPLQGGPHVVDLDRDGVAEVLLLITYEPDGDSNSLEQEVLCLSHRGKLRWRWTPHFAVRQGELQFEGPWQCQGLKLRRRRDGLREIWLIFNDFRWRPSAVVRISHAGDASVRFVNAGHIYTFSFWEHEGRVYVLAGGVNNEYAAASLAVFDADGPAASSPQTSGSKFDAKASASGDPMAYFLFEPTDLNRTTGPFNYTRSLVAQWKGFVLQTYEAPEADAYYLLRSPFEVASVTFSNTFAKQHRDLEKSLLLFHSVSDCPHLSSGNLVRIWRPSGGWTEVRVPLNRELGPDDYQRVSTSRLTRGN